MDKLKWICPLCNSYNVQEFPQGTVTAFTCQSCHAPIAVGEVLAQQPQQTQFP